MTFFGRQTPSTSANDYNAMVFVIQQQLLKLQTNTLVKVISCTTNDAVGPVGFVTVQPLVNQMTGNRQAVSHGQIFNIPYIRLQGGSNAIIMDPKPGDIGTMVCASRDISAVKSSKAAANPGSFRVFDWADGMYIPGTLNGTPTQYLRMSSGGIILLSPTSINIQSPSNTITGPLEVTGITTFDVSVTINGAVTMQSTLAVTGMTMLTGGFFAPTGAVTSLQVTSISPIGGGSFPNPVFPVAATDSITGTGLTASPLLLVGDTASPGNSFYYGTNSSGVKGWYVITGGGGSGTVTSVGLTVNATYIAIGGTSSPITTSGTFTLDLSVSAKAALALAVTALQPNGVNATVTNANLTIVNGQVTVATNGTGGSGLFNLTVDLHPVTPTGVGLGPNDEFEQASGTGIDTAGTRYSGATPWTAFNIGSGTAVQSGNGVLAFTPTVAAGVNYSGYTQPLPSLAGNFSYLMKISGAGLTTNQLIGLLFATSSGATGHLYLVGTASNVCIAQRATNSTTFSSNQGSISGSPGLGSPGIMPYLYYRFDWVAATTTFTVSASFSGDNGSFFVIQSETAATFLGSPALIGFGAENQSSAHAIASIDFFRRIA